MSGPLRKLARLLVSLGQASAEVSAHPDDSAQLRYRPMSLPPDWLEALREHHEFILTTLADAGGSVPPGDSYVLGERLGTADELGLPTHPGSAAWLIAVGESVGARR